MSNSIKILIVEDEEMYRLKLEAFMLELGYETITPTDNSEEAIDLILTEHPDLIIMDININGELNGIEVAQRIKPMNIPVLFITSEQEKDVYLKAKSTFHVGYLVKPFNEVTLQSAIEYALIQQQSNTSEEESFKGWEDDLVRQDSVLIKHNNHLYKVYLNNILFIQAKGKLSVIHSSEKKFISNSSLSKLYTNLPSKQFIRIHKSYIVNVEHIDKIILKNHELIIGEQSLPIGRVYKEAVLKRFNVF